MLLSADCWSKRNPKRNENNRDIKFEKRNKPALEDLECKLKQKILKRVNHNYNFKN